MHSFKDMCKSNTQTNAFERNETKDAPVKNASKVVIAKNAKKGVENEYL